MRRKEIFITKKTIKNLYLSKRLNAYQIAKKIDCGSTTVYRELEKYGIKRRDNSECHMKYNRLSFSGDKKEMAYMIGFRLGDLHVRKAIDLPGCKTVRLEAHTTKKEQAALVKSLFERYSHVHSKKILNGSGKVGIKTIRLLCFLDDSFSFLLPKYDGVEDWIANDKNLFLSFLAGYIDAEGHFGIHSKNGTGVLQIQTQDKGIIQSISRNLIKSGIHCPPARLSTPAGYRSPSYPETPNNKDKWNVAVHGKELMKLLNQLFPYLRHKKRKSDALRVFNYLKGRYYEQ